MSDKILLAFCAHSHQPVGNYDTVFEKGASQCYMPLLHILKDYPQIKMTLHYTGPLFEWFEANEPSFFTLLNELVSRSQVEMMGGGFYEPILSVIPEHDARQQIEFSKRYINERFGVCPSGMWCAERIWDPGLPKKLSGLDIEYTLLDDSHFLASGLRPEDIHGYYITEREGCSMKIFPIDMQLRYLIPFKEPREVKEYLLSLRDRGVKAVTYGDDGEKFGMWPGTHKWVIEERWLRRFFDEMSNSSDEIEVVPLSTVIKQYPPNGLVYLPTASYQEMMEWSLFPHQGRIYGRLIKEARSNGRWNEVRPFLRGGMWDNFLAKYPESNLMHKKMLKVSSLVQENKRPNSALKALLMAQCNCPYWHGLFGGIYISSLRHAVYENLLTAERIIDESRLKDKAWVVDTIDHDLDGNEEVLISGRTLNCYISPSHNASVFAVEYKAKPYNFSNILMRHPEIYHNEIIKTHQGTGGNVSAEPLSIHDIPRESPEEYKDLLIYDKYPRNCFVTHIMTTEPDLDEIVKENRVRDSVSTDIPFALLSRNEGKEVLGLVFSGSCGQIEITKSYEYHPDGNVNLMHSIIPTDEPLWIAVEWNIMVNSGDAPLVDNGDMAEDRGIFHADNVIFRDAKAGVELELKSDAAWDVCITPIECISQSEKGFEKTFQGWSVFFIRRIENEIPCVGLRVGEICQS